MKFDLTHASFDPSQSTTLRPSAEELAYYQRRAHELRTAYLGATLAGFGSKLAKLFSQLRASLRADRRAGVSSSANV